MPPTTKTSPPKILPPKKSPHQLHDSTAKAVLLLALPVLTEQILAVGVGLVDTWLTGNYLPGDSHLAAIGQISYLLWLIPCLFAFIGIGATALVSRSVGGGDRELANQSTNQAFLLGILMSVLVTAWLAIGGDWFVEALRLPTEAAELAKVYLRVIVWVIPAIMLQRVAIACLYGAGDTISGMLTRIVVNVANILFSIALVTGWGPFPELGWKGIAVGTAMSHVIGAVILTTLLIRGRAGLKLHWRLMLPNRGLAKRMLRIGVPGGVDILLILTCHLWFLALINGLGTAQAAAHSLGVRIESLAYLPGIAFEVAASTLAGQYLGANDPRRAGRSVIMAVLFGGGVMTLAGVAYYIFGFELASHFTGGANPQTATMAAGLLKIVAFAMPCLAISMIGSGALRGAGDTRWPMVINLIGMLGFRIPMMYLILGPGAGYVTNLISNNTAAPADDLLTAAWYIMVGSVTIRAFLVLLRFLHGDWKKTVV